MPDAYLQAAKGEMIRSARIDLASMLSNALGASDEAIGGMVGVIAATFGAIQTKEKSRFRQAHQDVGEAAMRSIAQGFVSRRFRRPVGQYRVGDDRLTGKLGRALSNTTQNVLASEHGLAIVNTGYLDREAAHWRRLNFGAGGGGREGIIAPQQFAITWEGVVAGTLGLETQPSHSFVVPYGYWVGGGGGPVRPDIGARGNDQFFVGNPSGRFTPGHDVGIVRQHRKVSRGIASRNFLDAGVRRVANELPRAYEAIYNDLYENARGRLESVAAVFGGEVIEPSPQGIPYHYRRSNRVGLDPEALIGKYPSG